MSPKISDRVNFADKLLQAIDTKNSRVVVGLDPVLSSIPKYLAKEKIQKHGTTLTAVAETFIEFNAKIIDNVAEFVVAVKPQIAFYEQYGPDGLTAFIETIRYAHSKGLIVIADVKRNDIGSTAQAYAKGFLGKVEFWNNETTTIFDADAITVNPYLGFDGIKPFVQIAQEEGKGLFILARTSNPSAGDIQGLPTNDGFVFEKIGEFINKWGQNSEGSRGYRSVGAVVGATYPDEAKKLRKLMPKCFFLVPGYGAQGAMAKDIQPCFNSDRYGAVVNSSRNIIYAYSRDAQKGGYKEEDFAQAAGNAAKRMRDEIEQVLR
jgi:orotidine-5'-phosphate decarboxylase